RRLDYKAMQPCRAKGRQWPVPVARSGGQGGGSELSQRGVECMRLAYAELEGQAAELRDRTLAIGAGEQRRKGAVKNRGGEIIAGQLEIGRRGRGGKKRDLCLAPRGDCGHGLLVERETVWPQRLEGRGL